jgi:hypothetical protein
MVRQCKDLVYSTSPHKLTQHLIKKSSPNSSSMILSPQLITSSPTPSKDSSQKDCGELKTSLEKNSAKKMKKMFASGRGGSFELQTIKELPHY